MSVYHGDPRDFAGASFPAEFRSDAIAPLDGSAVFSSVQELRHGGEAFGLRAGGGAVARSKRAELLAALSDGENVELEMDFRAFQQIDGQQNANHLRFKNGILRGLARSFRGVPLIRDHEQDDVLARAGTVTKSQAIKIDGGLAFDMTALVTAPWAVEALLRGNIDRFSIGWAHGGLDTIMCSHCGTPIFRECFHFPGDKLADDDGNEHVVEFVFTEATGVEVSGVSVPAVAGTGIAEVRSALSRSAAALAAQRRTPRMEKIALALGLPADASEEAILAALAARTEANSTLQASVDELSRSVEALTAANDQLLAASSAQEIDALFTEHADRLPVTRDDAGNRIASDTETQLRALAANDLESARAILSSLPRAAPTGPVGSTVNVRIDPVPTPVTGGTPVLTPPEGIDGDILASQLSQLGMTAEQYAEYGPHNPQPSLMDRGLDWVEFATARQH